MAAKKNAAASRPAVRDAAPQKRVAAAPRSSRKAGDELVTIDRRRNARRKSAEPQAGAAESPALERRAKVQRRRQIDPTTCERDYTVQEVEFMNAMDEYKRKSGRMFPTCSEVLEVIRELGYVQLSPAGRAMLAAETNPAETSAAETDEALPTL